MASRRLKGPESHGQRQRGSDPLHRHLAPEVRVQDRQRWSGGDSSSSRCSTSCQGTVLAIFKILKLYKIFRKLPTLSPSRPSPTSPTSQNRLSRSQRTWPLPLPRRPSLFSHNFYTLDLICSHTIHFTDFKLFFFYSSGTKILELHNLRF
jgi:hypothetical protein